MFDLLIVGFYIDIFKIKKRNICGFKDNNILVFICKIFWNEYEDIFKGS